MSSSEYDDNITYSQRGYGYDSDTGSDFSGHSSRSSDNSGDNESGAESEPEYDSTTGTERTTLRKWVMGWSERVCSVKRTPRPKTSVSSRHSRIFNTRGYPKTLSWRTFMTSPWATPGTRPFLSVMSRWRTLLEASRRPKAQRQGFHWASEDLWQLPWGHRERVPVSLRFSVRHLQWCWRFPKFSHWPVLQLQYRLQEHFA